MGLFSQDEIRKIINDTTATIDATAKEMGIIGVVDNRTDLNEYANRLFKMPHIANAFMANLYNQFIYAETAQNLFTSAFDHFRVRRDGVGFGTYETDVQPIFPLAYDMTAFDRVLDFWKTPTIVQYFGINRSQTFPQSLVKKELRQAFQSYDAMNTYLEKLILAPRRGNTVIENNAIKEMINANVASGAVKKKIVNNFETEADYKAFAALIQEDATGMCAEPSTDFNNYYEIAVGSGVTDAEPAWAQSSRDDLCLIAPAKVLSAIKTYVLAFAFNQDDVDFKFTFIPLHTFGYKPYNESTRKFGELVNSPILAILCDGGWIKLEDNFDEELSDSNCMTAGIQRALQIDQTYAIRAYRNAIAYCLPVEPTAKAIAPTYATMTSTDDTEEFEITNAEGETVTDYEYTATIVNNSGDAPVDIPANQVTDFITLTKGETGTLNLALKAFDTSTYSNLIITIIVDGKVTATVEFDVA